MTMLLSLLAPLPSILALVVPVGTFAANGAEMGVQATMGPVSRPLSPEDAPGDPDRLPGAPVGASAPGTRPGAAKGRKGMA